MALIWLANMATEPGSSFVLQNLSNNLPTLVTRMQIVRRPPVGYAGPHGDRGRREAHDETAEPYERCPSPRNPAPQRVTDLTMQPSEDLDRLAGRCRILDPTFPTPSKSVQALACPFHPTRYWVPASGQERVLRVPCPL